MFSFLRFQMGKRHMKRILLGSVAMLASLTCPVAAADLAAKAPAYKAPPPVVAVYNWTGFYLGGNVGGAWAKDDVTWSANPAGFGGGAFTAALNAAGTGRIDSNGVTAGGQIGFNYQINSVVVWGVEADLNYTDLSDSRSVAVAPPAVPGTTVTSTFESKWLATVRGRVGVLPTQTFLLYATGGVAFAEIKTSDFAFFAFDGTSNAASSDKTKTGWTVGAGAEWALNGGWSVKAEYLYVDLGSINYTSSNSSPANPLATINHDHRIVENIGRVGVNYRFNAGPVVAKY
jgi:outer membrane immunogenic protein